MPLGLWNSQWQNQNGQRRYPLADDATCVDETGAFRLPDDFIVGLDLPVHAGVAVSPAGFFVMHVGAYSTGYSVIVGYQPESGDPVQVATALVPAQTHSPNTTYALGGTGEFDDTMGKITIGRLDGVDAQPSGFFTFTLAAGRIDPDAVRPIIRGVSSITCVNGGRRSRPLYGHVELEAGQNMQLVPVIVQGRDPVIRISAINGEGTVEPCVCDGDSARSVPIRRINGVAPTPAGDLVIAGSDCVQVEATGSGLRLTDTCAQPCCGPTELERITRDLERLGSQAAAVESFVARLQNSVTVMDMVVLGSRLGDRGCGSCE